MVWLAQLVEALTAPMYVLSCTEGFYFPEQTSWTLCSIDWGQVTAMQKTAELKPAAM